MDNNQITQSDVRQFMSWRLSEDTELYHSILDAIIAEPDGEVARWCNEHRQQTIEKIDSVFHSQRDDMVVAGFDSAQRVDMDLLRDYHTGQLPELKAQEVDRLLVLAPDWQEASELLLAQMRTAFAGSNGISDRPPDSETKKQLLRTSNPNQLADLAYDSRTREYLQRPYAKLITHPSFMTVAHRSGGSPLDPYMERLERLICKDWQWEQQRQKPELQDDVDRVRTIAELIRSSDLNIPYDSQLVAAILVKAGLDELCDL